mgnify:CR=1 FL=1
MTGAIVALVACVAYVLVSLVVGDRYPFSRYSMYARLTTRSEGAVLYVRAGDRFVRPEALAVVHGLDIAIVQPRGKPCSQEWLVYEAQRWLEQHSGKSPPENGVPVEVGWRMLRVDAAGMLHERLEPITSGTGLLR